MDRTGQGMGASEHSIVIGIDPGRKAAVAVLETNGPRTLVIDTQDELDRLRHALAELRSRGPVEAWIERVAAYPGQGVSSTFTFGRSLGALHGLLVGVGVPVGWVSPRVWQRMYGVPAGLDKPRRKRFLRGRAADLFPELRVTLQTADALLIAHWARTRLIPNGGDLLSERYGTSTSRVVDGTPSGRTG